MPFVETRRHFLSCPSLETVNACVGKYKKIWGAPATIKIVLNVVNVQERK